MSEVTIDQIKQLRTETNASPVNAKKALIEAGGDFDRAKDILKRLSGSAACKKLHREAKEGVVGLKVGDDFAVIMRLCCETDFVARNSVFQALADKVLHCAYENRISDKDQLLKLVNDDITEHISLLKENIVLSVVTSITLAAPGIIAGYIHNKYTESLGKIAALVVLRSKCDNKQKLDEIGRKVAVHVVATSPEVISISDLDDKLISAQKAKLEDDINGKPENVAQRIIDGKLAKYYKSIVLLEQDFIMDNDVTVGKFLNDEGGVLSTDIAVAEYKVITLEG